jgi:hypothetical protein
MGALNIDLERFRLPSNSHADHRQSKHTDACTRQYSPGRFLKGPIPLDWIITAAKLPGKALHVGIALWFLAGLKRSRTVVLTPSWMRQIGLNRDAMYRGLAALERTGLVTVLRQPGKASRVTLVVRVDDRS